MNEQEVGRQSRPVEAMVGQWELAETAPRDGSEFVAYREDAGFFIVRWAAPSEFLTDSEIEQCGLRDEELHEPDWMFADFIAGGRLDEGFTHWMIPSTPNAELTRGHAAQEPK